MAISVALIARSAPRALPTPISDVPAFSRTLRTSAKSRLISPGLVMRLVIPCTPESRTSSAMANASVTETLGSANCNSRSFGTTIRVSTSARSLSTPASACSRRRRASNPKGVVTTPMVSAPIDLAIRAMTGAPPVPVPPPSPAVMNTRSAPVRLSSISVAWSSAARRPISGSAPAPSPRVSSRPTSSFTSASLLRSACASVLTAMNSTPLTPPSIIRLTALTPPPPTPTTLMTARKLLLADAMASSNVQARLEVESISTPAATHTVVTVLCETPQHRRRVAFHEMG